MICGLLLIMAFERGAAGAVSGFPELCDRPHARKAAKRDAPGLSNARFTA